MFVKITLVLILVCGLSYGQSRYRPFPSVQIDSTLMLDSLSGNPLAPTNSSRQYVFGRHTGAGSSGIYKMYRGVVTRIDSLGAYVAHLQGQSNILDSLILAPGANMVGSQSGHTVTFNARVVEKFSLYSWTTVDSFKITTMMVAGTVDSIYILRVGGTSATVNVTKHTSNAWTSDLLSSNFTAPTAEAPATGMQNLTFVNRDQLWAVVRTVSGTVTELDWVIWWH